MKPIVILTHAGMKNLKKIKLPFVLLLLGLQAASSSANEGQETSNLEVPIPKQGTEAQDTFNLLQKGEEVIELDDTHKEFILVVGNTGAGKSTITQFLARNTSNLLGVKVRGGTYKIVDAEGTIGNSTTTSTSIFPERLIDSTKSTDNVFYDCPGYSDTRNTSVEIANTYFIKKVADHSSRLKIILVASAYSVGNGLDRKNFLEMIRQTLNIFPEISKFKSGIALMVTKVHKPGVEPEDIVDGFVGFLEEARENLQANGWKGAALTNAQVLIDSLLATNATGTYTRIGFLRQPRKAGPLSQMPEMDECKISLNRLISGMSYVNTVPADFGYTLSAKALNDIQKIATVVDGQATQHITSLAEILETKFLANFTNLRTTSEFTRLKADVHTLSKLPTDIRNFTMINETIIGMKSTLKSVAHVDLENPQIWSTFDNLQAFGKLLNFLQAPNKDPLLLNTPAWCKSLETLKVKLAGLVESSAKLEPSKDRIVNIVRGNYIFLSDILRQMRISTPRFDTLLILARDTIFIDVDLVATELSQKSLSLAIIAPKWIMTGRRTINLNGRPGVAHVPYKARTGVDGLPGLPGDNAGRFWAVGQEFDGELPQVTARGGKGGPGQAGGDGVVGITGQTASICDTDGDCSQVLGMGCYDHYLYISNANWEWGTSHSSKDLFSILTGSSIIIKHKCYSLNKACTFYCYGEKGKSGSTGHDGGVGGFQGNNGQINFYIVSNTSAIELANKALNPASQNNRGENGARGNGGAGGENGKSIKLVRSYNNARISLEYETRLEPQAARGSPGRSGVNWDGIKTPPPLMPLPISDFLNWFNDFVSGAGKTSTEYFKTNLIKAGSGIW